MHALCYTRALCFYIRLSYLDSCCHIISHMLEWISLTRHGAQPPVDIKHEVVEVQPPHLHSTACWQWLGLDASQHMLLVVNALVCRHAARAPAAAATARQHANSTQPHRQFCPAPALTWNSFGADATSRSMSMVLPQPTPPYMYRPWMDLR